VARAVKDIDHGYKARVDLLSKLARDPVDVVIGILARTGASSEPGGRTVLEVATWQEFGTVDQNGQTRIPARSFIRQWFDENRDEGMKRLTELLRRVAAGKLSAQQAYDQFGLWAVGSVQQRIAQNIPPPLAESTVKRKGSSVALIDTGQLRSSVAHEVRR
jgi:hypothetical protein